jgi:hypothetical protein
VLRSYPVHNIGYGDFYQGQDLFSHELPLIHDISVYKYINLVKANYGQIIARFQPEKSCNSCFHGDKSPNNTRDLELAELAFQILGIKLRSGVKFHLVCVDDDAVRVTETA